MSARYLTGDELNNDVFQMFYDCLRKIHGVAYADFVLGAPKEIILEQFPAARLRRSYNSSCCVSCNSSILPRQREDALFESMDEVESGEVDLFYLCEGCQEHSG